MRSLRFSLFLPFLLVLGLVFTLGACAGDLDSVTLRGLMDKGQVVLIDVRTPEEYAQGHIPGALLLPYDQIDQASIARLVPQTGSSIVVYCRSGRRSAIAVDTLRSLGYQKIQDFGAVSRWSGGLIKGMQPR